MISLRVAYSRFVLRWSFLVALSPACRPRDTVTSFRDESCRRRCGAPNSRSNCRFSVVDQEVLVEGNKERSEGAARREENDEV